MVPSSSALCWTRLASGGLSRLVTQHLGAKMLAKRIERSSDPLATKALEIHTFFTKWQASLRDELAQLDKI